MENKRDKKEGRGREEPDDGGGRRRKGIELKGRKNSFIIRNRIS